MSFEIKLPLFEGPFDLLLFFIQRDELDIHDIPISKITKDFLDYLHQIKQMNIEVASEFILVAATLMKIKSKMLIPRQEIDEHGIEIDPREELINRLIEYKKYKSVIDEFSKMETIQSKKHKRGNLIKELNNISAKSGIEDELQDLDLYKLFKVYQKALAKFEVEKNKPTHQVIEYPYTISEQKIKMLNLIKSQDKVPFEDVIKNYPEKIAVIFNFLAILELLQLNLISIAIGNGYNNFWLRKV